MVSEAQMQAHTPIPLQIALTHQLYLQQQPDNNSRNHFQYPYDQNQTWKSLALPGLISSLRDLFPNRLYNQCCLLLGSN